MTLGVLLAACGGGGGGGDKGELVPSPVQPVTPGFQAYFPLAVGNRWVYGDRDSSEGELWTDKVSLTQASDGETVYQMLSTDSGSSTEDNILYAYRSDGLWRYPSPNADPVTLAIGPQRLIAASNRVGESFVQHDKTLDNFDFDGDGRPDRYVLSAVVTVIGYESVSTTAGSFPASLHLRTAMVETITTSSNGSSIKVESSSDDWYAPDVGPVQTRYSVRGGGIDEQGSLSLVAYRAGVRRSESLAPTVTSVSPAASGAIGSNKLVLSASFSERMDAASLRGSTFLVTDAAGNKMAGATQTQGKTATFQSSAPWADGRYTARISTAAEDLAGNALLNERSWSFEVDAKGPAVLSVTPAADKVDVPLNTVLSVTFNEPIDPASISPATVQLTGPLSQNIPVNLSVSGSILTVTPTAALARSSSYLLTLGDTISDMQGQASKQFFSSRFQTTQGSYDYPVALTPSDMSLMTIAAGDINSDGLADVLFAGGLSTGSGGYTLQARYGQAQGLPGAAVVLDASWVACQPDAIVIGDLNGDGRADVAIGGNSCGIQVLLQDASGKLMRGQTLTIGGVSFLRLADIDGDGRRDLVAVSYSGTQARILRQDAAGQLQLHREFALGLAARDIEVADLNGDGRADIVVSGWALPDHRLALHHQQADGSFSAAVYRSGPSTWSNSALAVGDLNGDGRLDVAAATGGNSPTFIAIYLQKGNGELAEAMAISSYDSPSALRIADMNGDGRADVVVGHVGWNAVGIYLQQADGSLAPEERYRGPYGTHNVNSLAIADINNDGRLDIVDHGDLILQKNPAATAAPASAAGPRLRGLALKPVDAAARLRAAAARRLGAR